MPKRRIAKKRRKKKRAAPTPTPLACSEGLSRLFSGRAGLQITRGQAVSKLWATAKARGVQRGKTIHCDAEMAALFGVSTLGFSDVAAALAPHLSRAPPPQPLVTEEGRRAAAARLAERAARAEAERTGGSSRDYGRERGAQLTAEMLAERRRIRESLLARSPAAPAAPAPSASASNPSSTSGGVGGGGGGGGGAAEDAELRLRLREAKRALRALREAGVGTSHADYHRKYAVYAALKAQLEAGAGEVAAVGSSGGGGVRAAVEGEGGEEEGEEQAEEGEEGEGEGEEGEGEEGEGEEEEGEEEEEEQQQEEARGEGRAAGHSAALPEELLCPILLALMVDPVSTADGQCYERAAIERWLRPTRHTPRRPLAVTHSALHTPPP